MLLGGFCNSVVSGAQSLWRNMDLLAGGGREGHCNQRDVVVSAPVHWKMCSLWNKPLKELLPIDVW